MDSPLSSLLHPFTGLLFVAAQLPEYRVTSFFFHPRPVFL